MAITSLISHPGDFVPRTPIATPARKLRAPGAPAHARSRGPLMPRSARVARSLRSLRNCFTGSHFLCKRRNSTVRLSDFAWPYRDPVYFGPRGPLHPA